MKKIFTVIFTVIFLAIGCNSPVEQEVERSNTWVQTYELTYTLTGIIENPVAIPTYLREIPVDIQRVEIFSVNDWTVNPPFYVSDFIYTINNNIIDTFNNEFYNSTPVPNYDLFLYDLQCIRTMTLDNGELTGTLAIMDAYGRRYPYGQLINGRYMGSLEIIGTYRLI